MFFWLRGGTTPYDLHPFEWMYPPQHVHSPERIGIFGNATIVALARSTLNQNSAIRPVMLVLGLCQTKLQI